jgi:chromate reductase
VKHKNVGVIVGSLRQGAYSRMLARALREAAPSTLRFAEIEIGRLPLYNQDLETATPPAEWVEFRKSVMASDALLFVTPEYNRSMPGALKNAIDVGSRPWGRNAWDNKPAAVISISPGQLGGMAANHHLRQTLYGANLAAMAYPEAYINNAASLFDESGRLVSAETKEFAASFMRAFEAWIVRLDGGS